MLGVNYDHLTSFYNLFQTGAETLDQAQGLMINYLNRNVKKCQEDQPAPFSDVKIEKLCTRLKTLAAANPDIIYAIDQWKKQWLKQQGVQHQAAIDPIKFQAKAGAASALPLPRNVPKVMPAPPPFHGLFVPPFKPAREDEEPMQAHTKEELLAALSMSSDEFILHAQKNRRLQNSYRKWRGENRESISHLAAQVSTRETLRFLSNCGASLNRSDNDERNCMHYAAEHNKLDGCGVIDFLFEKGEGEDLLFKVDVKGYSPMHVAILKKSSDILIVMLWNSWQQSNPIKLPSGDNELHLAAQNGFISAFSMCLLQQRFRYALKDGNNLGLTPLQIAAREGHLGIVRLISTIGKEDISKQDEAIAISLAREHNQPHIFEFLTTGAVANSPTYEDLKAKPEEMVELINRGLDINGLQDGKSMLHRAIEDDYLPLVIQMINEGGASLTVKAESNYGCDGVGPNKGLPALYFAASLGRAKIARYLNETFYNRQSLLKRAHGHADNPIELATRFGHGQEIGNVIANRGWN